MSNIIPPEQVRRFRENFQFEEKIFFDESTENKYPIIVIDVENPNSKGRRPTNETKNERPSAGETEDLY